ncbi:MAG: helix-turn-helix domain-containing protein [Lachnospiraceae bacterium]|nr:helix-turn-helix domain-containing protein [Lachnospiraceae bacterium]
MTIEIEKALSELKKLTGTDFEVSSNSAASPAETLTQLRYLITAYQEKYNKTDFLVSLMHGPIPSYDLQERAKRLHIDPNIARVMLLIELKSASELATATEILKNLVDSRTKTLFVPINKNQIALLKPIKAKETNEHIRMFCHMLTDTLNMEALVSVHLSYSETFHSLLDLAEVYRENTLALRIGKLFHSDKNVFPNNKLGVGRLIGALPLNVCEDFITELFGTDLPEIIDDDTQRIISRFIRNNQNIAETAKQLHMHRNTLILRLEKIEKSTGLDLRQFEDAMTLKIAMMVMSYYQTERKQKNE